jgi:chromosome segregation ATPase
MSDLMHNLSRRRADLPREVAIALGNLPPGAEDATPTVQELQPLLAAQSEAVERARSQIDGPRAVLDRCDAELQRLREEIDHCTRLLPSTCAAVILGQAAEAAEASLLERLERAQRIHRRHELARPTLEAMLRQARAVHAPLVSELNELELRLERAREIARRELAAASIGWRG